MLNVRDAWNPNYHKRSRSSSTKSTKTPKETSEVYNFEPPNKDNVTCTCMELGNQTRPSTKPSPETQKPSEEP